LCRQNGERGEPSISTLGVRNFITGDVRMTAEVDEKARAIWKWYPVRRRCRAAAIEAMKQYRYAPATKEGKGVASQVRGYDQVLVYSVAKKLLVLVSSLQL
jgi:hypothetical protein